MWGTIALLAGQTLLGTNTQDKVAMAQNKATMSQLGKQINQINLQRAQSLQQTSAALYNIDQAAGQGQSQVQLQSAASGTMGASVQDAVATINSQADAQRASAYRQESAQMESYRLATASAVDSAHASMDWESGADKLWNNTLSTAGGFIGSSLASGLTSGAGTALEHGVEDLASKVKDWGVDAWNKSGAGDLVSSWKSYLS